MFLHSFIVEVAYNRKIVGIAKLNMIHHGNAKPEHAQVHPRNSVKVTLYLPLKIETWLLL